MITLSQPHLLHYLQMVLSEGRCLVNCPAGFTAPSTSPEGRACMADPNAQGSRDTGAGPGAASSSVIGIAVGVSMGVVLLVIVVIVVVVRRHGGNAASAGRADIVSFENPMYEEVSHGDAGGASAGGAGTGLYDEVNFHPSGEEAGYQEVLPDSEQFGIPEIPMYDHLDMVAGAAGTAESGYMDVAPHGEEEA